VKRSLRFLSAFALTACATYSLNLRHHRTKKNATDGVASTAIAPFCELFALTSPVTFMLWLIGGAMLCKRSDRSTASHSEKDPITPPTIDIRLCSG